MRTITYRPIGIIRTSFKKPEGTPIQASRSGEARGTVEVLPEYMGGLKDLDGLKGNFTNSRIH